MTCILFSSSVPTVNPIAWQASAPMWADLLTAIAICALVIWSLLTIMTMIVEHRAILRFIGNFNLLKLKKSLKCQISEPSRTVMFKIRT